MNEWIDAILSVVNHRIGMPYDIQHLVHVEFDSNIGFSGKNI